ncbi:YcxB family protein [Niallia taxi]|uniref:YcxB family protein n=1 Tax=Niallia taxi TaxID=2499688 RepID=UPI0015F4B16F|nr:YcxB family protein [Niallia taxi]
MVDELSITYRLKRRDLWLLYKSQNKITGNKYVNLFIMLGIPLLLAISLIYKGDENIVAIIIYFLVYVLVFIPITILVRLIINLIKFQGMTRRKRRSLKGVTLTLSEKGVMEKTEDGSKFISWKDIEGVDSKEKYFLIYVEQGEPYIIPKRYFKTAAQWNEFVGFAFTCWSHDQTGKRIR